jgi:hypothetical protein
MLGSINPDDLDDTDVVDSDGLPAGCPKVMTNMLYSSYSLLWRPSF